MPSRRCHECTNEYPTHQAVCPHCGRPSNFPNVFEAAQEHERSALMSRYETARSPLLVSGIRIDLLAHLIRFHGVLAPNAKLRREIVPSPPEQATAPACDHAPARLSWTRLLKRVFDIDIEHCPNCGGALKIIACPEPSSKGRYRRSAGDCQNLAHLGLPTRAPPRSPAQRFDLFQTI